MIRRTRWVCAFNLPMEEKLDFLGREKSTLSFRDKGRIRGHILPFFKYAARTYSTKCITFMYEGSVRNH